MPNFPGYHLTPASKWVKLPPSKQEMFKGLGGFPVNDAFIPLWTRPDTTKLELLLLYGGYGSSKTTDRIMELVLSCITQKYFRCYYGRMVFETAKKELHSNIVTVIKDLGVDHLFTFSEQPNGNKEITCTANGNRFKPFGCDNEESLKGLDNPTHIFIDELDQIPFSAFGRLLTRLRSRKGNKCLVGCFNTPDVFEDHWIRAILLNKEKPLIDAKGNPIKFNIIEHFSTYLDNYFIDPEEYLQQMSMEAGGDPTRMAEIVEGLWGSKTQGQPFYKMFSSAKQVWRADTYPDVNCDYNPGRCLWVSFDENVNPALPVLICQSEGKDFFVVDEIYAKNPHNSLEWVCGEICRRYKGHKAGMKVTGDATSQKDDVKIERGKDLFVLAMGYLAEFNPDRATRISNPNVKVRGGFINAVFGIARFGLRVFINPKCTHTIRDFKNTAEAPDGNGKDKTKHMVEGIRGVQPWGHLTDCFDYVYCVRYEREYNLYQAAGRTGKTMVGGYVSPNSY